MLVLVNVNFIAQADGVEVTVGRYTATGATAAQSTNIVTQTTSLALPGSYMASLPTQGDTKDHPTNLSSFAIDSISAGTYYYRIWMSSTGQDTYAGLSASLAVMKVG